MDSSENHQDDLVPPVEGVAGGGTAYGWNDGILHDKNPCNCSTDPTEVPTADLVHVWCMPSTANIGAQEMPRHLEHIGYRAIIDIETYSAHIGCPRCPWPLNLPVSQINLSPGETIALWVSVDVPSAQPPGQYEGEICITSIKPDIGSSAQFSVKYEKHQLNRELKSCLNIIEPVDGKSSDDVVERARSTTASLRGVLVSPLFSEFFSDNGPVDTMDEDAISNLSLRVKINLTVWDFILPVTHHFLLYLGYLILLSRIALGLNMGVMSGMRHWISISSGFFSIESAHVFVDGAETCVFWHTLALCQLITQS